MSLVMVRFEHGGHSTTQNGSRVRNVKFTQHFFHFISNFHFGHVSFNNLLSGYKRIDDMWLVMVRFEHEGHSKTQNGSRVRNVKFTQHVFHFISNPRFGHFSFNNLLLGYKRIDDMWLVMVRFEHRVHSTTQNDSRHKKRKEIHWWLARRKLKKKKKNSEKIKLGQPSKKKEKKTEEETIKKRGEEKGSEGNRSLKENCKEEGKRKWSCDRKKRGQINKSQNNEEKKTKVKENKKQTDIQAKKNEQLKWIKKKEKVKENRENC